MSPAQTIVTIVAVGTICLLLGYLLGCEMFELWRKAEGKERILAEREQRIADLTAENLALRRRDYRGTIHAIPDIEPGEL